MLKIIVSHLPECVVAISILVGLKSVYLKTLGAAAKFLSV